MNKILLILCVAAGLFGFSAARAQAAQPVNTLPAVAHINQTVVVETGHRRHYRRPYYRHHHYRRHYYRHHRRYYY